MLADFVKIADIFSTLPGIGRQSAYKIGFHLLKQPRTNIEVFAKQLIQLKDKIEYCNICGALKEINIDCQHCHSATVDRSMICIVEEPSDIYFIDNTNQFNGLYHVLMGALSPIDGITPEQLRMKELFSRISNSKPIREIIIATNPTIEGNATAYYLAEKIKEISQDIKVSRISSGLAIGSKINYVDSQVLAESISSRNEIQI